MCPRVLFQIARRSLLQDLEYYSQEEKYSASEYLSFSWRLSSFHWKVLSKIIACGQNPSSYRGWHSKWLHAKRGTNKKEELKCTSVFCPFHVEPCRIRHEVFRSRFLGSIVQFADFLTNDEIVALTRNFFFAHQIAPCGASNLACFKRVASEEHSCNGVFRCWTLDISLNYTNPGHQEGNHEPEFGIHFGTNARAFLLQA